jgi:methionyl-tRNA formyltransferase
MPLKIVFMGTPAFAIPTLQTLVKDPHFNVLLVVTKPDKPSGRGLHMASSPIKVLAQSLGIPIFQPNSLKDKTALEQLQNLLPDFIVVVAYGFFLPKSLTQVPRLATINLHPSLLPRYRGAAPLHWPIINGDAETGVTTMLVSEQMDAGDILLQQKIPIHLTDSAQSIHDKLANIGAACIRETMLGWEAGIIHPKPQNESEVSFAPKITDEVAHINWREQNRNIFNKIRGLSPLPGAQTTLHGIHVILYAAALSPFPVNGSPGSFNGNTEKGITINCGHGTIEITELKLAGKKKMPACEFVKGYRQEIFFQ